MHTIRGLLDNKVKRGAILKAVVDFRHVRDCSYVELLEVPDYQVILSVIAKQKFVVAVT